MTSRDVPCFSQHLHIKDKIWRKKSCGIVCLAILLNFFGKNVSPEKLLKLGLKFKFSHNGKNYSAYVPGLGWTHWGLARMAERFGSKGIAYDWSTNNHICKKSSKKLALKKMLAILTKQPLMVSINKTFENKGNGHLVVLTGFNNDKIFYNDPNYLIKKHSCGGVSKSKFLKYWTKRAIAIN